MDSLFLAARGRGLANLIKHLLHLEPSGWFYLGASAIISIIIYLLLNKYIPIYIRKITKHSYPFFTWIAIPQYKRNIALSCFWLFFCFVGYFSRYHEDVEFFIIIGILMVIYILFSFAKVQHSFMFNQNEFYISSFALLGKYKKLYPQRCSLGGDPDNGEIIVKDGDKQICKIEFDMYSKEAQKYIWTMLMGSKWTSV